MQSREALQTKKDQECLWKIDSLSLKQMISNTCRGSVIDQSVAQWSGYYGKSKTVKKDISKT